MNPDKKALTVNRVYEEMRFLLEQQAKAHAVAVRQEKESARLRLDYELHGHLAH